jgi:sortase A
MSNEINSWKMAPGILIQPVERILLCIGCLLLGVAMAAQIDRAIWLNTEMRGFRAAERADLASRPFRNDVNFGLRSDTRNFTHQKGKAEVPSVLAILRIPRSHLQVPVLEGTGGLSLNRGVGHISGTPRPGQQGNIGIAGHRDGFFRLLRFVGIGDFIELESPGRILTYRVNQLRIVNPGDVEVLSPREVSSVTLITCYPFNFIGSAPRRYVVEAVLIAARTADASAAHEPQISSRPTLKVQ